MSKDNWSVMSKEAWNRLEKMAQKAQSDADVADLASGVLNLVSELRYLNGCVKRGRGTDIDTIHPCNNVFEYIKELEALNHKEG